MGTSAGIGGGDAAAAVAAMTAVSGDEAGWLATVADRFDMVFSKEEAARLAAEMPLPRQRKRRNRRADAGPKWRWGEVKGPRRCGDQLEHGPRGA